MMAQLEESNLSQLKEGDELRANVRELENTRQEARREIQQLHNQVIAVTLLEFEITCCRSRPTIKTL